MGLVRGVLLTPMEDVSAAQVEHSKRNATTAGEGWHGRLSDEHWPIVGAVSVTLFEEGPWVACHLRTRGAGVPTGEAMRSSALVT